MGQRVGTHVPEQIATRHRTRDCVSLWIVDALLKRRRPVTGRREVTRNFESVLVIDNAPIRLCAATMVARPCEFPERADRASGLPPRVHQIVMFARGSTL